MLVIAAGVEAHCRAAHLWNHHELRALDTEHRGDAVQQLARALADLARGVEDLGGPVQKLVAVGAALALAGGDLPGEHQDHRRDECEGEDRTCRQDHQRDHAERSVGGGGDDLEEVRPRHLADIQTALRDRGAEVERDGIDEPPRGDHRGGEGDDAVHRKWIGGDRSHRVEHQDSDADVDDIERRVGEILDPADAPLTGPAGEQDAHDVAREQLTRVDEEQADRDGDLGQRERGHLAMHAHLDEQEARHVAVASSTHHGIAPMRVTRWTSRSGSNQIAAPISARKDEKTASRWGPLSRPMPARARAMRTGGWTTDISLMSRHDAAVP